MSKLSNSNSLLMVVAAVALWSTGGLFIKMTTLDAYSITFLRSIFAAVTVMALTRKQGLSIDGFGLMTSIIYALLLFLFVWATKMTTAANAIFLQYTAPVYILILGPFLIGEKFRARDLVTVIAVLTGMTFFFLGQLRIEDYQGNIAALLSGTCMGLYIMLLKHPRSQNKNPAIAVIYGNLILAVATLPFGISAIPTMTVLDWGAVIFLGVIQIGFAYILFIKGVLGGTRPLDASLIGFIEPLLNPVWVFLFIGERPAAQALIGGAIIISAIFIHTLRQYSPRSSPA